MGSMRHDRWNQLRQNTNAWLTSEGGTRATLEGYFSSIERHLERDRLDEALHMSAALPEICSALEHPRMTTSSAHCICWCDAWVASESNDANVYPLTRVYLRPDHEKAKEWIRLDAEFTRSVSQALLHASRNWYLKRGAYDLIVQQNLGRVTTEAN